MPNSYWFRLIRLNARKVCFFTSLAIINKQLFLFDLLLLPNTTCILRGARCIWAASLAKSEKFLREKLWKILLFFLSSNKSSRSSALSSVNKNLTISLRFLNSKCSKKVGFASDDRGKHAVYLRQMTLNSYRKKTAHQRDVLEKDEKKKAYHLKFFS